MSPTPKEHYTTERVEIPLPRETRRELMLLVGAFVTARLMSIWWFQPLHNDVATFLFPFAHLQGEGVYPFIHYWFEYFPVQAYLLVGLRGLAVALCGHGTPAWECLALVRTVQVASVVWELAILHLIYSMVKMLRGPRTAVRACWIYVALFSTAFVSLSYVDSFPVFLMLAGVLLAAYGRPMWAAGVAASGFMAKLFPVALLPMLLKCEARWRWRLAVLGAFALTVAAIAAPFAFAKSRWLQLSFEVTSKRPPWETVWALLDRRYEFGYVGPDARDRTPAFFSEQSGFGVAPGVKALLDSVPSEAMDARVEGPKRTIYYYVAVHFATNLKFLDSQPRTGDSYWWIYGGVGIVLGIFYLITLARLPSALPPRRRIYLAAFSMFVLFFYSKGWSPQFVLYLIPLVLIAFPTAEGGLWALLLTVATFVQMPVWAAFVHGHPGMLVADRVLLHVTVIARTVLFIVIAVRLYPRLFND